ncbi:hypothetical protein GGH94_000314 [Coemansia aciculifera]|uniref:Uncharacterized protein n=1 Tax=Coemansia aciculifera TaxID=417176 RepID=A0A9W8IUR4_9FUNG|nr:hypothetical protein GGH94_000314 [Coemansia aciculifera]KAJ2877085.1 hypothetical protein GGH93_000243 [Coemansia aciculifera]
MAITAAFGMGNARRPGHLGANAYVGPRLHMGRASLVVADATDTVTDMTSLDDRLQQRMSPLDYHILQSGAMSSTVNSAATSTNKGERRSTQSTRQPAIGGIRRIMRRAHTPEGLVLHYEARLRAFLGIVPEGATTDSLNSGDDLDDGDWQMIEQEEGLFTPFDKDSLFDEGDLVVLGKALTQVQQSPRRTSPEIVAGVKSCLVAEWGIQDSFTRLVVHNMCRYYGLVSFSNTLDNGQCVLHICHPRFFKDAEDVNTPRVSFYNYLYKH